MDYKNELLDSNIRIGVWGCGYIGFTTMINYAKEGIYSRGYDVDSNVVEKIHDGEMHIPNLDYWIGHHLEELIKKMITATTDRHDMLAKDIKIHLVAVPTEKNGEPYFDPLMEVMDYIAQRDTVRGEPDLIIIESTLTPGMFQKVVIGTLENYGHKVGEDILVGIAPRRDWFDSPEKNLKVLNRVIGGTTPETTHIMKEILSVVCDNLIESDASTVELVKSVENSIFHVCAVYASQLADAYPDTDIQEVLKLASTHWRIPLYYPTVGTGGYCIPVSSKYVLGGAKYPHYLTLTKEAIESDNMQPKLVAELMVEKIDGGSVGVLGLSYKKDLKVHTLSPSLKIIRSLREEGLDVKVFDPYYTKSEIKRITAVKPFNYPEDLHKFDGLIIIPPHRIFSQTPRSILISCLNGGQVILDNEGVWAKWREEFKKNNIDYHRVGDKDWAVV